MYKRLISHLIKRYGDRLWTDDQILSVIRNHDKKLAELISKMKPSKNQIPYHATLPQGKKLPGALSKLAPDLHISSTLGVRLQGEGRIYQRDLDRDLEKLLG